MRELFIIIHVFIKQQSYFMRTILILISVNTLVFVCVCLQFKDQTI